MQSLMGTPIDDKNIELAKLLYGLRQDLDVYCLISVNADKINARGYGKAFFGHICRRAIDSIALGICKIYETEKGYQLNSIDGVLNYLARYATDAPDGETLNRFILNYAADAKAESSAVALRATVAAFRAKYSANLQRFKEFRNKQAAHSEYNINITSLPSYDVMEKLFLFAAEFYNSVAESFIGGSGVPVTSQRPVKTSLHSVLRDLGLEGVKTDME
jgi:hypothetical protein